MPPQQHQLQPHPPQRQLRPATLADLPQMMAILNEEIAGTVNCFRTAPMTQRDSTNWWRAREDGRYPALVAETSENTILGWASLSRWSSYEGYAGTAEVSIWLIPSARGQGLGRALFTELIAQARQRRFRVLLSRIEANNRASLALHRAVGFTEVGTMHNVGEKFNQLLDVTIMQLQLTTESNEPADSIE